MAAEYDEGDFRIPHLDVSPFDLTTVVTLAVESPAGVLTSPALTPNAGRWTGAGYELVLPGDWIERWTVTNTGKGRQRFELKVAPDPGTLPTGARVYATTADYAKHLLTSTPTGARRALLEASRDVDKILLCAVYPVNVNGMPTDPKHVTAMRDATCAQAEYARDIGDPNSVGASQYHQMSIATVQLTRGPGPGGSSAPGKYSPRAIDVLQAAGLNAAGPESW